MIPILFENNEIAFTGTGLGRLRDCVSCIVTEERNGIYECDFEYPVSGVNYELIQIGRIIAVTHDDTGDIQPFDIVSTTKPLDGIVTFHCVHISYRLSYVTVPRVSNVNDLNWALTVLRLTARPIDQPFRYETNMTKTGYAAAFDGCPHSVRELLGGTEGSIIDTYGGELEFDRFNVKLLSSRGIRRNFTIRYGVNMLDYNNETDISDSFNSCYPYWAGNDEVVVPFDTYAQSGKASPTGRELCVPLDLSDKFENAPTEAQLITAAEKYMDDNQTYLPTQTITVSFARIQDMAGYEDLRNLYQCNLCDLIKVVFPEYNTNATFEVVKTTWNVLFDRYDEMELGTLSKTLSEALGISGSSETKSGGGGSEYDDLTVNHDLTVGNDVTVSGDITATNADIGALSAGTISATGSITADGHSSPIGTIVTPSTQPVSTSVNSSTSWNNTNSSVTLPAGTWLLIGFASFPTKSGNNRRAVRWMKGSSAIDGTNVISAPTYDALTNLQTMAVQTITASTTFRLSVLQNSGTNSMSVTTYAWAVRIV